MVGERKAGAGRGVGMVSLVRGSLNRNLIDMMGEAIGHVEEEHFKQRKQKMQRPGLGM